VARREKNQCSAVQADVDMDMDMDSGQQTADDNSSLLSSLFSPSRRRKARLQARASHMAASQLGKSRPWRRVRHRTRFAATTRHRLPPTARHR
jgi:hypothetical protein